jgi:hypothetical protein
MTALVILCGPTKLAAFAANDNRSFDIFCRIVSAGFIVVRQVRLGLSSIGRAQLLCTFAFDGG